MLEKYFTISSKLQNMLAAGLMIILAAAVFLQVLSRKLLPITLPWTEEVAKISLIWLTYLALAATFQQNYHIRIDLIDGLLNTPKKEKIMSIIINVMGILFAFMLVSLAGSYFLQLLDTGQTTSIMRWPMWLITLPILIGGVLTLIHYILKTGKEVLEMRERP